MSVLLFNKYFRKYWVLENKTSFPKPLLPMIPDSSIEVLCVKGGGFTIKTQGVLSVFDEGIYLGGQLSGLMEMTLKPFTCIYILKLRPETIPLISDFQISEITDSVISLKSVNKQLHYRLYSSLKDSRSIKAYVRSFLYYLDRNKERLRDADFIKLCASYFQNSDESFIRLKKKILQDSKISSKTLENKFNQYIGLTPKVYVNTFKLRKSVESISFNSHNGSLTQLALDNGYYDQSHFIREFKGLFKKAPTQLDFNDYFIPNSKDSFRYYTIY